MCDDREGVQAGKVGTVGRLPWLPSQSIVELVGGGPDAMVPIVVLMQALRVTGF